MSYFSGDFLKISSNDAVPVTKYSILMSGYLSKKLLIIGAKNEVSVLDKMLKLLVFLPFENTFLSSHSFALKDDVINIKIKICVFPFWIECTS